jgi:hypothetical protein
VILVNYHKKKKILQYVVKVITLSSAVSLVILLHFIYFICFVYLFIHFFYGKIILYFDPVASTSESEGEGTLYLYSEKNLTWLYPKSNFKLKRNKFRLSVGYLGHPKKVSVIHTLLSVNNARKITYFCINFF